jgi:hypothetical protein
MTIEHALERLIALAQARTAERVASGTRALARDVWIQPKFR